MLVTTASSNINSTTSIYIIIDFCLLMDIEIGNFTLFTVTCNLLHCLYILCSDFGVANLRATGSNIGTNDPFDYKVPRHLGNMTVQLLKKDESAFSFKLSSKFRDF